MQISVQNDINAVIGALDARHKRQLPFAIASALTKVATQARKEVKTQIPRIFDRPTPWIKDSVRYEITHKGEQQAKIFISDDPNKSGRSPAMTLQPQIVGGVRGMKPFERQLQRLGLRADQIVVPAAGCKLDQYGNMARGFLVQILAYLAAFGEEGYKANMTAQGRGKLETRLGKAAGGAQVQYFVSRGKGQWQGGGAWRQGRSQHLPAGIWQRTRFARGSAVKPVLLFVRRAQYRARFDFPGMVIASVQRNFSAAFQQAWSDAIATAR